MPINSFEDYPMSWKPNRTQLAHPLYTSIASLLEYDILNGSLAAHTKLPPQRELADFLDVNLSTITRAFKICELKGLIYASIGKGTFVSPNVNSTNVLTAPKTADYIEMGIIRPFYQLNTAILNSIKSTINKPYADLLLEYSNPLGSPRQKRAGQSWLSRFGLDIPLDNIFIASGAQNALTVILLSLFQPGAKIATDLYTHPNFINLAKLFHIQLIPIKGDASGMLPEALDAVCKITPLQGIYLMPSYSNPTGITLSMKRRSALAAIIKKYELTLIEDDVYAFLLPREITPLTALIPKQSIYISGTSKSLCPGLRVAFVAAPDCCRSSIISGIYNINVKTSSLNTEIIAELIHSGMADKITKAKIQLATERNNIFHEYFPLQEPTHKVSFFQWLPLPKQLSGQHFEELTKKAGVRVLCSDRFSVGDNNHAAFVRLAVSSPSDSNELRKGLGIIKSLIKENSGDSPDTEFFV